LLIWDEKELFGVHIVLLQGIDTLNCQSMDPIKDTNIKFLDI